MMIDFNIETTSLAIMPVMALMDEMFLPFGSPYCSSHAVGKLELGQYTNISIYCNTDNHNIISIHPITVSIYRNIDILQYIDLFYVKAYLKSTTCLFAISNDV